MNTTKLTLAALLLGAFTLPAFAQSNATPGIDQRQANQERRIEQGVKSGELNKREAARLERGQKRVEKMEEKAKADGVVTKKERAHIQHAQNHESRKIAREKHDRQHAHK